MLSPDFLKLTRCPNSGTPLRLAEPQLLSRINRAVESGRLTNKLGEPVTRSLDAALLNEAGDLAYPVFDEIPVLLIDEAIELHQVLDEA